MLRQFIIAIALLSVPIGASLAIAIPLLLVASLASCTQERTQLVLRVRTDSRP